MKMNKNSAHMCELLAPAGNFDSLCAAVQSGADAVYLGATNFSARASAGNFDDEQLKQAVSYVHLRGVKIHAALNTLIKQSEFSDALKVAQMLYMSGVDALIVQDFGLARAIKYQMPDFEIHASTQMTVHNEKDAEVLKKIGYKRVVLARELDFETIKQIKENVDIEVEMFVHGAVCMSYSGQCLFSSIIGGRSGNRGRCAQPCRLEYEFLKNETLQKKGYILSPKDMCLIEHLEKIKQAKIDSLKIEGRLKKSEYVAAVTGMYRKYLDTESKITKSDYEELLSAFNRSGFTDGYFKNNTGAHMMSYKTPSNIADEKFSDDVLKRCDRAANLRKVKIDVFVKLCVGEKACVEFSDEDGNKVSVFGNVCEIAKTKAADEEYVSKQISRLGNTVYDIKNFNCLLDGLCGIGAGELNKLRRDACDELDKMRTAVERKTDFEIFNETKRFNSTKIPKITVQVQNAEQAQAALKHNVRIYAPAWVKEKLQNENIFIKEDDISNLNNEREGKLLSSHLHHAKQLAYGDFRLNVFNAESAKQYQKLGFDTVCLSPELNFNEIKKITAHTDRCEIIAYGYLPLMIMRNCVLKSVGGRCVSHSGDEFCLKDRKGERFRIMCNGKESCTNTVLNSKPLYMADKSEDLKHSGADYIRLMFTVETKEECEKIITAYEDSMANRLVEHPECFEPNKFTRGHFYRGVL